jgi:peptide-methionine (S)-S-oxide reductase
MEIATIGGGCFWCVEAVIQRIKGVNHVSSGYMGGHTENPDYRSICTGTTGHAEVIRVEFDPEVLSFEKLLEIFFIFHDPTTLNRQGNDVGTQYRSVIFYNSERQKEIAENVIANFVPTVWDDQVVTQVVPEEKYYEAEKYHQNYYNDNSGKGYCTFVVGPKVSKLRSKYAHLLKSEYTNG